MKYVWVEKRENSVLLFIKLPWRSVDPDVDPKILGLRRTVYIVGIKNGRPYWRRCRI